MLKIDGNDIYLTRGNTAVIDVTITDGDAPYIWHEGDSIEFAVRRKCDYNNVVLSKRRIEPSFTFIKNDTKDLALGEYIYSITLFGANGSIDTFIVGKFTIECEVYEQ